MWWKNVCALSLSCIIIIANTHSVCNNVAYMCIAVFQLRLKIYKLLIYTAYNYCPHGLTASAFELLLQISSDTVLIHYDTVFNMGDFHLLTLSFHDSLFKKHPIIPLAYLIHTRRFQKITWLSLKLSANIYLFWHLKNCSCYW